MQALGKWMTNGEEEFKKVLSGKAIAGQNIQGGMSSFKSTVKQSVLGGGGSCIKV